MNLQKNINTIFDYVGFLEGWSVGLECQNKDAHALAHDAIICLKDRLHEVFDKEKFDDEVDDRERFRFASSEETEQKTIIWKRQSRKMYEWTPENKQKLLEMRNAGENFYEISKIVGRTPQSCNAMYYHINKLQRTKG